MRYKLIILSIGIIAAYGVMKFCLHQTGKFMVTEIMSSRLFDPAFETRPLNETEREEIEGALNQKYTYFGCGGQAFIFFSHDGNFVLKFFKQRHFYKPTYLNYFPFIEKYRERKFAKKAKHIQRDYNSYKIGFEEIPELTGLVYLHLNKSSHLNKSVTLIDKLGIEHTIDLDTTDFILQRRASMIFPTISSKMSQGDSDGAKKIISEVIGLILARCEKGLRDQDPNIATNCGILKGRAIKIDVGRFSRDPVMAKPTYYKAELYYLTRPLQAWLKRHYPELGDFLEREVLKVIRSSHVDAV